MKILLCGLALFFVVLCGCESTESAKKPDQSGQNKTQSSTWKISFERIGGVAGFRDRLVLYPNAKSEYYDGSEKKFDFELLDETIKRLDWIIQREDLLKEVGEYKGGGKVMDDIYYTLLIEKDSKTWSFKWATQVSHPAIFDEIRPVFDDILSDVKGTIKGS